MNRRNRSEIAREALYRATASQALTNIPAVYAGFVEKGISEADIQPRVNVFTYHAWQALGRQVRRGEHGVRIVTYIVKPGQPDPENPEARTAGYKFPRSVTVFHISQTDPLPAGEPSGTLGSALLQVLA